MVSPLWRMLLHPRTSIAMSLTMIRGTHHWPSKKHVHSSMITDRDKHHWWPTKWGHLTLTTNKMGALTTEHQWNRGVPPLKPINWPLTKDHWHKRVYTTDRQYKGELTTNLTETSSLIFTAYSWPLYTVSFAVHDIFMPVVLYMQYFMLHIFDQSVNCLNSWSLSSSSVLM